MRSSPPHAQAGSFNLQSRIMTRARSNRLLSRSRRGRQSLFSPLVRSGLLVVSDHRIDAGCKGFHGEGLDHYLTKREPAYPESGGNQQKILLFGAGDDPPRAREGK
jgi:hypothetical protein